MSAIAEFRLLDVNLLNELKDKSEIKIIKKGWFKKEIRDEFWDFLNTNSQYLNDFGWTGYVFADLLIFLQENKEINLLDSTFNYISNWISHKRRNTIIIFTYEHKKAYLEKINSLDVSIDELITFNTEFSENPDYGYANAGLSGIKAISEHLKKLTNDSEVIILTIV